MTKILDIQQSIIAANGNVSLAKELFTMLLDDLDVRRQQIESSFQAGNKEVLAEHVHKLYGATAYCIVPTLRECTETLEERLRQKDYSQLDEFVGSVLEAIQKIINTGPDFIKKDWLDFQIKE
ncbi:MAG: Hpt domain-containing protein [Gammaproteobacteria bacterium]|nr:Hpt domain-containing protein [Gammaproteobacteria bacterium]